MKSTKQKEREKDYKHCPYTSKPLCLTVQRGKAHEFGD